MLELVGHPDQTFVQYLVSGLRHGFDLGYFGPDISRICRNLYSALNNPSAVDAYLTGEIQEGRIYGPFSAPPFQNFQCHPIGIVPKKEPGKFRAITDLSYPPGISVNDYIDKDEFSLKYITIDLAINFIQSLGQGCYIFLFLSKNKCSKGELLSLIGSLSFACKVITPGRPFLARLIQLSCSVKKLHHRVYLNK